MNTAPSVDLSESAFESPPCTLCGSASRVQLGDAAFHLNVAPPIAVVACARCGLKYLSPRPGSALRAALHGGVVPESLREYGRHANYAGVSDGRRAFFRRRVGELTRLVGGGRVLDVGASSGVFVSEALRAGWEIRGLEPGVQGRSRASEEGIELDDGAAEALPYGDASFDLVHSHHVFEHLVDPLKAAREARRVLRPGGMVFIEVPNQLDNVMFKRDVLLRRVPQRARDLRSIHHLWFFSKETLHDLLARAGFEDIVVKDRYSWKSPGGLRGVASRVTRLAGRVIGGGDLIQAHAFRR